MLEFDRVCAGYGKHTVLKDLSLSFATGQVTAVIGVNGCGKSTLLKTAVGILPTTQGEILLDGNALSHRSPTAIARSIAYLPQGKPTPDMTVEQLVLHGRFPYLHYPRRYTQRDRAIAHAAMERVDIASQADRPLSKLSGGMRQTAYLAMALAQNTEYILLDEPTTYLDIAHQLTLLQLLRTLAEEGKGVVAVMHDLPMAMQYADCVAVIQDGHTAFTGSPHALCQTDLLPRLFGIQVIHEHGRFALMLPPNR